MNIASRGVVLAVAAVILGIVILGQGFDDPDVVSTEPIPSDDSAQQPTPEGTTQPADDSAADGSTEPADDGSAEEPADDSAADGSTEAPADDTTDGATEEPDDSGIPDVLHDPSEVRVLVVNGTSVSGAAGSVSQDLVAQGYTGLNPTNTNPPGSATETSVYYEAGYRLDATALAQTLNAPPASVEPLPDDVPVDDLLEANVVIILGPDLVTG